MAASIRRVWARRHQTGVQYFAVECTVATTLLALRWIAQFTANGMCAKKNTVYAWRDQATTEWSRRVIFIVACCHSAKLCALAARAFRSQQHQGSGGCSQNCCSSTATGASKPSQERDAWCQLLAKWLKMSAVHGRPVQRYSEVFTLRAEGEGLVIEVETFSSRLTSL